MSDFKHKQKSMFFSARLFLLILCRSHFKVPFPMMIMLYLLSLLLQNIILRGDIFKLIFVDACFCLQIGLFDDRPASWHNALTALNVDGESGYYITNISLGEGSLPAGWNIGPGLKGPHCLWPWVGAGDDQIEAYNCLKIQPTWMEDNA